MYMSVYTYTNIQIYQYINISIYHDILILYNDNLYADEALFS